RGLLLQRFAQLVEQARIFDRNHRLGGEVLQQLNLLVAERLHLLTVEGQVSDRLALLEHGHYDDGTNAGELDAGDHAGVALGIRRVVQEGSDVHEASRSQRLATRRAATPI